MTPTTRSKRKHLAVELETELWRCAGRGDLDRVRELVLIERVNVNCTSSQLRVTPLISACSARNIQVAQFLLENGANVEAVDEDGDTALSCAILHDHVELAELLLEYGANVEARFYRDEGVEYSPLGYAILRDNVRMVGLLLRFGANTKELAYKGLLLSALHVACGFDSVEIVRLLLSREDGELNVNRFAQRNGDRPASSPLCMACMNNSMEIAQLLIQHGAFVIFPGVDSPCPLSFAVHEGSLELVRLLLDNSPFATNHRQSTPRPETGFSRPLTMPLAIALELNKLEAAQLLVDYGANVNDSLLGLCSQNGWCHGARFLLQNGADVNVVHNARSGQTPLWTAASVGNVELVQEFLKAGADVNIRDNNSETPLGVAYREGHKGAVYLLHRTRPHVWSRLAQLWQRPRQSTSSLSGV